MTIKSAITHKEYNPENCVYIANMLQAQKYLVHLGPSMLYDILYNTDKRPDSLVFVFPKNAETKHAKELWDQHLL